MCTGVCTWKPCVMCAGVLACVCTWRFELYLECFPLSLSTLGLIFTFYLFVCLFAISCGVKCLYMLSHFFNFALVFETRSLIVPGLAIFARLVGHQTLGICWLCHLPGHMFISMHGFYVGAGDLNSCLHVCKLMELPPLTSWIITFKSSFT